MGCPAEHDTPQKQLAARKNCLYQQLKSCLGVYIVLHLWDMDNGAFFFYKLEMIGIIYDKRGNKEGCSVTKGRRRDSLLHFHSRWLTAKIVDQKKKTRNINIFCSTLKHNVVCFFSSIDYLRVYLLYMQCDVLKSLAGLSSHVYSSHVWYT